MSFKGTNILQAIREEINRFENVHPRIYAVYDILDALPPEMGHLVDQMRQHVAAIEDSFVNSQEWTLSRGVKELRLGIVGAMGSGKSSLVHRYLTGTYSQDDSPEGGRFKKEVTVDGHCYLLLIRDEGSLPDAQFTHWADAVIFVFALDNEATFDFVWTAYSRMSHFRNISGLPTILVGTQDGISESSPRMIDEKRARRLAADIHSTIFLETCALYGLNVDRVFLETCQRIIHFLANHGLLHNGNTQQVQAAIAQQIAHQGSIPPISSKPAPSARIPPRSPDQHFKASDGSTAVAYVQQRYNAMDVQRNAPSANSSSASLASTLPPNSAYHQARPPAPPSLPAPVPNNAQKVIPPGAVPTAISRHTQQLSSSELYYDGNRQQTSTSALHNNTVYGSENLNGRQPQPQQTPAGSGGRKSLGSMRPGNEQSSHGSSNAPGMVSLMHQLVSHLHKSNSFTENDASQMCDRSELTVSVSTGKDGGEGSGSPPDKAKSAEPPGDTPNQQRKTKRRSNIFSRSNKDEKDAQPGDTSVTGAAGGAGAAKGGGRVVPVKEGVLHKRCGKTGSALSRETWKKKYVVLLPDGRIIYHPNMHDYLDGEHGKVILLRHTTVKVPGGLPAGSSTGDENVANSTGQQGQNAISSSTSSSQQQQLLLQQQLQQSLTAQNQSTSQPPQQQQKSGSDQSSKENPKPTKRGGRRSRAKTDPDGDPNANMINTEFSLVSLDGKQWVFDCATMEERDDWVQTIQRQIASCLQANDSCRPGGQPAAANAAAAKAIRAIPGNTVCADCSAPDPAWAVYNAGVVVCIDCSGVHRQLGVHVSRVKSLDLDDWAPELVAVMCVIGNQMANSVLEAVLKPGVKPNRHSTREEREWFVRAKYEHHHFAANLASPVHGESTAPVHQQLIDAVAAENVWRLLAAIYSLASPDANIGIELSRPYSAADRRTALHVAVQLDSLAIVQLLLLHQADLTARDQDGRAPADYARSPGVASLLQQVNSR